MYLGSFITYLIWPALIFISYLIIRFAVKKFEKREPKPDEGTEMPV